MASPISMTSPLRVFLNCGLVTLVLSCLIITSLCSSHAFENRVDFPQTDRILVGTVLAELSGFTSPSDRIVKSSEYFLGRPYKANTLIGGPATPERLYADFSGFDCFTFLDVVEALRRSAHVEDFLSQLTNVRYKDNEVAYLKRRHFFSDWVNSEAHDSIDITASIDPINVQKVRKQLNKRTDGSLWVEGLPVVRRTISFLPSSHISKATFEKLESGDYLGFYSSRDGLDVQHTGILVKSDDRILLRHASSVRKAVVDENLMEYLQGQEGLVVYRVNSNE